MRLRIGANGSGETSDIRADERHAHELKVASDKQFAVRIPLSTSESEQPPNAAAQRSFWFHSGSTLPKCQKGRDIFRSCGRYN